MTSPYQLLDETAFWSKTAAVRHPEDVRGFYLPKFEISKEDPIALAGSCFAQHVGRALRQNSYHVIDREPLPAAIPPHIAQTYGYRMYSARYGNIYTIRQMRQLLEEAFEQRSPADRVWTKDGAFFDAQRPNVDPKGLGSVDDVLGHRAFHLSRVREVFEKAKVFVFTFGLTEAWCNADTSTVFPTAPGTIAGLYDPALYEFKNFRFSEIMNDFKAVREILRGLQPNIRILTTVSPVPLTATASTAHVEVATAHSKAVLRAVCGELYEMFDDVDYYPSYEIITAQAARARFYDDNLRTVRGKGVNVAIGGFIDAHQGLEGAARPKKTDLAGGMTADDVVCEDLLLDGFAKP